MSLTQQAKGRNPPLVSRSHQRMCEPDRREGPVIQPLSHHSQRVTLLASREPPLYAKGASEIIPFNMVIARTMLLSTRLRYRYSTASLFPHKASPVTKSAQAFRAKVPTHHQLNIHGAKRRTSALFHALPSMSIRFGTKHIRATPMTSHCNMRRSAGP